MLGGKKVSPGVELPQNCCCLPKGNNLGVVFLNLDTQVYHLHYVMVNIGGHEKVTVDVGILGYLSHGETVTYPAVHRQIVQTFRNYHQLTINGTLWLNMDLCKP